MIIFIITLFLSMVAIGWVMMEFTAAQVINLPAVLFVMLAVSIINSLFFPTLEQYQSTVSNKLWLVILFLLNASFFLAVGLFDSLVQLNHAWQLLIASSVYSLIIRGLYVTLNLKRNLLKEGYTWLRARLTKAKIS